MATLVIEPVVLKTSGNFTATITGINPANSDCLSGTVDAPTGKLRVRWSLSGICRDNPSEFNFDTRTDEFQDLAETARAMGC